MAIGRNGCEKNVRSPEKVTPYRRMMIHYIED